MYEYRPTGLLRVRNALIVLALRWRLAAASRTASVCSDGADDVDGCGSSTARDALRDPAGWRGDVGHELEYCDVCGARRDLDDTLDDLRRKTPGLVSVLQRPKPRTSIEYESHN